MSSPPSTQSLELQQRKKRFWGLSAETKRALWAVVVLLCFSLAGLVRQTALLDEVQAPRIQAIGGLLLDAANETRVQNWRNALATLANEVWAADQDLRWLRIQIDDGKTPIAKGQQTEFNGLPHTWRDACFFTPRFDTRSEYGRLTAMAGAPAAEKAPGFCVFVAHNTANGVGALQAVLRSQGWILCGMAIFVFAVWRRAPARWAIPILAAAVFVVNLSNHVSLREVVERQLESEASKSARLAAVDFKIALQSAPLEALADPALVKDSLRDYLNRDKGISGVGIEIKPSFQHWEKRVSDAAAGELVYGREPLPNNSKSGVEGQIVVAVPNALDNFVFFDSLMLLILLSAGAWACSRFLVDVTEHHRTNPLGVGVAPIFGAFFFFLLAEEVIRPALLLELQQEVSGMPQGTLLWVGLNSFWLAALWGAATAYAWFHHFPAARIFAVCAAAMSLCLLGQGLLHDAWFWMAFRAIEGFAFGLGFQAAIVYASRLADKAHRLQASAQIAQGALVAVIVGPILGGAVSRIAGPPAVFYLAALTTFGAAAISWYLLVDKRDEQAQSVTSMLLVPSNRRLTIPLMAMGIANRCIWFAAAGLLIPTVVGAHPQGAALVGELIGLLGLGMYCGRRCADRFIPKVNLHLGWVANLFAALIVGSAYLSAGSIWVWMFAAFSAGFALIIGSRAQLDWVFTHAVDHAAGLHGASRLADRAGTLLAAAIIPPLLKLSPVAISLTLLFIVVSLWLLAQKFYSRLPS